MKLFTAIASGRKFRRVGQDQWDDAESWSKSHFTIRMIEEGTVAPDALLEDVTSDDWELAPLAVTITPDEFQAAIDYVLPNIPENDYNQVVRQNMRQVAVRLGLVGE